MWIDLLTHSFPTRRSSDLMRKVLAASENRTCTNPVLDMAAERGLNPLVPDARDVARQHVEQKYRERAEGQRSAGQREAAVRSEEHTSELQSLMRISYAVFCLKRTKKQMMHYTSHIT